MSYVIRFIAVLLIHVELSSRSESLTACIGYNLGAFPLLFGLPIVAVSNQWTNILVRNLVALSSVESLDDILQTGESQGGDDGE